MSEKIKKEIQTVLAEKIESVTVGNISSVGGGCINDTARIKTNIGLFFAKWNKAKKYPKMFEAEAKGLKLLADANEIKIPEVISQKTIDETDFLILEFIESGAFQHPPSPLQRGTNTFWHDFGKSLAKLHKHTSEKFGLDHDNYIGSLPQSNKQHNKWNEFFILERLEPQIKMAIDSKQIHPSANQRFHKLFSQVETVFPAEKPSLLHGDLWNGNYLIGSKGEPVIIDPAVYFGHREMDLGMTKLFGGFTSEFYQSYNEEFPLEKDWQKRTDLCNLYPLMVHVNLFGRSYAMQVEDILRRF